MKLKRAINDYVVKHNTTKDAFARELGFGHSSFSSKLRGTSELSLSEGYRLSRKLSFSRMICSTIQSRLRSRWYLMLTHSGHVSADDMNVCIKVDAILRVTRIGEVSLRMLAMSRPYVKYEDALAWAG